MSEPASATVVATVLQLLALPSCPVPSQSLQMLQEWLGLVLCYRKAFSFNLVSFEEGTREASWPLKNKPVEPKSLWKQTSHTHNLPPGLEYLNQLDRIIIHQQVELLEAILGTETSSKYEIKNHLGQRVYFAVEENDCFDRNLCSPIRSFTIRITDNTGREVITVNRPLRCNSCCFPCFLQELEVQSPPGITAGYVVQNWDPFLPKFTIQNESKEDVLKIIGPYATCGCFEDVDFEVKTLNEMTTIGKISKYWSGFVNNVFTNTANFGIQVPVDLDVRIKAVMIGACFLIDLMFFENSLDRL
ncbi:PREDICTED: phospholipid scramblase family member 5-like [Chaetura pelagica]|uniref:phospholipid scramblase family member 5-like n=1 Tax=Chaetura pelagica TaxID=8897 RepID=UPI000523BA19|nr:PREDICTED: phospholipid scramblase family member 5-like [Chaetura pelagica]